MQNHPILGDPLFAQEMLQVIDKSFGISSGPPLRPDSLIARMRRTIAVMLRKAADRVEVRPSGNQSLIDCNG